MRYYALQRGNTWSVYEIVNAGDVAILHNLNECQAKAIALILSSWENA